ncbi:MAG: DUF433 domain-containing protein [Nostoc sp.]
MDIQKILRDRRIIHSDPEIMSGTPVFVTRVPLQTFFDYLEGEAGLAMQEKLQLSTLVLVRDKNCVFRLLACQTINKY